jgi:hypothetical protein
MRNFPEQLASDLFLLDRPVTEPGEPGVAPGMVERE